jgi:hypothetical protein
VTPDRVAEARHWFVRRKWWWLRRRDNRYVCVACGFISRHYDNLDRWMSRPVHIGMSVAYKGVNTIGRDPQ